MDRLKHKVRLCVKLKEILFAIFALFFAAGLIVLRVIFFKDRNPNAELLIDLLRQISTNEKYRTMQKKEPQDDKQS